MDPEALLRRLADGQSHSGEALARDFGVTRAAVWKQTAKLRDWGIRVQASAGQGYRLGRPVDLLDREQLGAVAHARLGTVEVFTQLPSTNRYLLGRAPPPPGKLEACLAEYQTAGRGRRGRSWQAPLGSGLCLSVAWRFVETPPQLTALTLAIGVVARRVIAATAGATLELKWPNDLVWCGAKIGGILVELNAEAYGGCHVVAGLGLNVSLPVEQLAGLSDWPGGATDLAHALGGSAPPRRTELALAFLVALADFFHEYAGAGFGPYRDEWRRADFLNGRRVRCVDADGATFAIARGIDEDGALLLEAGDGAHRRMISGDVSLRAVQ